MRCFVRSACMGFLSLLTCAAMSQQSAPPSQTQSEQSPAPKADWREVWRNATVAFGEIAHEPAINHDFFHALGTGVIVSTDTRTAYFVTAKHMFCNPDEKFHPTQLRIRFAWQDHRSVYEYLGLPFNLRDNEGKDLWRSLDDDTDIAAIPASLIVADLPAEDRLNGYDSIPVRDVIGGAYEGESVLIFGYPGIVGNEKLVRAIVRQGIVAWTNPTHPDERTFLVDANLYPGNSGGPVIQLPFGFKKDGSIDFLHGGELKLLGIVSQVPMEDLKTIVTNPQFGWIETHAAIVGIGAIGVIEPGGKIHKLIEKMQDGTAKVPVCDVPEAPNSKTKK